MSFHPCTESCLVLFSYGPAAYWILTTLKPLKIGNRVFVQTMPKVTGLLSELVSKVELLISLPRVSPHRRRQAEVHGVSQTEGWLLPPELLGISNRDSLFPTCKRDVFCVLQCVYRSKPIQHHGNPLAAFILNSGGPLAQQDHVTGVARQLLWGEKRVDLL